MTEKMYTYQHTYPVPTSQSTSHRELPSGAILEICDLDLIRVMRRPSQLSTSQAQILSTQKLLLSFASVLTIVIIKNIHSQNQNGRFKEFSQN